MKRKRRHWGRWIFLSAIAFLALWIGNLSHQSNLHIREDWSRLELRTLGLDIVEYMQDHSYHLPSGLGMYDVSEKLMLYAHTQERFHDSWGRPFVWNRAESGKILSHVWTPVAASVAGGSGEPLQVLWMRRSNDEVAADIEVHPSEAQLNPAIPEQPDWH